MHTHLQICVCCRCTFISSWTWAIFFLIEGPFIMTVEKSSLAVKKKWNNSTITVITFWSCEIHQKTVRRVFHLIQPSREYNQKSQPSQGSYDNWFDEIWLRIHLHHCLNLIDEVIESQKNPRLCISNRRKCAITL